LIKVTQKYEKAKEKLNQYEKDIKASNDENKALYKENIQL